MVERGDAARYWANIHFGDSVEVMNFEPNQPLIFDPKEHPEGTKIYIWVPVPKE